MKALPIYVYKNGSRDCTNNGISSRYNTLYLICESGFIDIDENNMPENAVKLVTRHIFGKDYKYIEPYQKATQIGYMNGGNIAYSCDSRFSELSQYPLPIHDRQESEELNDLLSR